MLNEQRMKNIIREKSKETGIEPQQLYGLFALEQILVKLNSSSYKNHFILKGGYLLSTLYGLENRTTRDLDATIRHFPLNEEKMNEIVNYLTTPDDKGNVHFKKIAMKKTRNEFETNGYKLKLLFMNGKTKIPVNIDFTTGEDLIEINEQTILPLLFDKDNELKFPSYSIEQVLADKFYTTIAYGKIDDTNSRMKDYYDIYFLTKGHNSIDYRKVFDAINKTMKQRNNYIGYEQFESVVEDLRTSYRQQEFWLKFKKESPFVDELSFEDVIKSIISLSERLIELE